MTDPERHDVFDRGLASPFWQLFRDHVEREWGAGGQRYARLLEQLADETGDEKVLLNQMRQVAVARREIQRLLQWPIEEMKRCAESPVESAPTRAPVNERVVAGMTRGGL